MPLREVEPRSVASSREGFLVFVHNVEDLLQPRHMRSLLTCSSATSWTKMQGCITNLVKSFMDSQKLLNHAAKQCPIPRTDWTEDVPICSSPFCKARTGLWLPCKKEITRITKRRRTYPFEYMCADDKWGSLTLQSVIQDMKDGVRVAWDHRGKVRTEGRALVACSHGCGKRSCTMILITVVIINVLVVVVVAVWVIVVAVVVVYITMIWTGEHTRDQSN